MGCVGNIVPRYVFFDFILRNTGLVDLHLHCSGGIRHFGYKLVETLGCKIFNYFLAEGIFADSAHHTAGKPELRDMISEIGRCATYLFSFGEYVPQGFAHSYYIVIHDLADLEGV